MAQNSSSRTLPPKKRRGQRQQEEAAPTTSEDALSRGVSQEEQAERYQFGSKALRHLQQALSLYELAAQLATTEEDGDAAFDATFNGARVLVQLGETFAEGRNEPTGFVERGIAAYRQAITLAAGVAQKDPGDLDVLDARFNLAQALTSLADMVDEGAEPPAGSPPPDTMREVALVELHVVLDAQLAFAKKPPSAPDEMTEMSIDVDDDTFMGEEDEPQSLPFDVHGTCFAIVETCLAFNEIGQARYEEASGALDVALSVDPAKALMQVAAARESIRSRQFEDELFAQSSAVIASSPAFALIRRFDLDPGLETVDRITMEPFDPMTSTASLLSASASDLALLRFHPSLSSLPEVQLEAMLSRAGRLASEAEALHRALEQHLGSRLNPIPGLRPHEIPPMLTRNLVAQAEARLLLALLRYRDDEGPVRVERAVELAVKAFNASYPLHSIMTAVSDGDLQLRLVARPTPLNKVRRDWSALSSRLESLRVLVRCRIGHIVVSQRLEEGYVKGALQGVGNLIKSLGAERRDVERWKEEAEGDGIARIFEGVWNTDEGAFWDLGSTAKASEGCR